MWAFPWGDMAKKSREDSLEGVKNSVDKEFNEWRQPVTPESPSPQDPREEIHSETTSKSAVCGIKDLSRLSRKRRTQNGRICSRKRSEEKSFSSTLETKPRLSRKGKYFNFVQLCLRHRVCTYICMLNQVALYVFVHQCHNLVACGSCGHNLVARVCIACRSKKSENSPSLFDIFFEIYPFVVHKAMCALTTWRNFLYLAEKYLALFIDRYIAEALSSLLAELQKSEFSQSCVQVWGVEKSWGRWVDGCCNRRSK